MIYTSGWFYKCWQLQSEGLKGWAIRKAFQTGGGVALYRSDISLPLSPSSNFRGFFSLGNLVWLFPLCFVCTVWGCDKIQMFKIQEEHLDFCDFFSFAFTAFSEALFRGSSPVVQMSLWACLGQTSVPFRLVTPLVVFVQVWWFVAESVWKDGLLMWITGLVSEAFVLK